MKNLFLLIFFFFSLVLVQAQTIIYEDFEGGTQDIAWEGFNGGVYNGVVINPAPDAINSSGFVGSFTNDGVGDFNYAFATLITSVDLSVYNLIKMKVWSPIAPSQVLFKFEGGGNAVEMFRNITVANEWVEYSFDLSAGAPFTGLDKVLIAFNPFSTPFAGTFYFDDITAQRAIEEYETFEGGAALPWIAINGSFVAPLPNPDKNIINNSDFVGHYTKDTFEYSLLLADRGTPFDMSVLNQFHLQVYAEAPTQVLLKLEGPGGPSIEAIKNIGLINEWQDYVFDFSAAANYTHLTTVVLFFDPGVKTSVDGYYFDNLIALPQGVCKGVTPDPLMVDDFECNRNATYVNGWDSLVVVNNPEPNSVNVSTKVGKYTDPQSEEWATLLIDYQNNINLLTNNQLHVKIWAPREVPILFKLEGGTDPAKEIWVMVEKAGEWVDYEIDFSDQAGKSHKKIAIFFNAGQLPQPGDVYYIDDIRWSEKTLLTIEDFELGTVLPWAPSEDQPLLHGTFERVANPQQDADNNSLFVGKYTKGTSAFSTLSAVAPGAIDISSRPQYNLDVLAPGPGTVIMQLESTINGNKEVERTIKEGGVWQTLSFDFSEFQSISDWTALNLIFNPGVAEPGAMFFFDNLTQSLSTVDPCEGSIPVSTTVDDFECQRNYSPGAGAELLSVVGNPDVLGQNTSALVGSYLDQPGQPWSALCYDIPEGIDLSVFNQFTFHILAQAVVPVLVKLEGGSSPAKEIWTATTTPGDWETISVDFADQKDADHKRICIFFNAGVETTTVDEYFIDNLRFAHAPFTGCLMNFDDPAFRSEVWTYFPHDDAGAFEIVANPDPSGINTSAEVGKATEKSTGVEVWQGMYTDLPAPIRFSDNKIVQIKVWSPKETTLTMKLERPLTPGAPFSSGDVTQPIPVANEWTELSFDFSVLPDNGDYTRITLIWDISSVPSEDVIYYFDDISLTSGECATTSSNGPDRPRELSISPNPVTDHLLIEELGQVSRIDVYNLYGQRMSTTRTDGATSAYVNVSQLHDGTYILTGYTSKGEIIALSRFVKL